MPETVREHSDHTECDFPLPWDECHGALSFGGGFLVKLFRLALLAEMQEFARGGRELRAPFMMVKPRHRASSNGRLNCGRWLCRSLTLWNGVFTLVTAA